MTQKHSASAEESASASEEMRGGATHMKEYLEELVGLVEGQGEGSIKRTAKPAPKPRRLEASKKPAKEAIPLDEDEDAFRYFQIGINRGHGRPVSTEAAKRKRYVPLRTICP